MEDYDWKKEWGFDWEDWSSRYISPETKLDRYVNVDIAAGREFLINDANQPAWRLQVHQREVDRLRRHVYS